MRWDTNEYGSMRSHQPRSSSARPFKTFADQRISELTKELSRASAPTFGTKVDKKKAGKSTTRKSFMGKFKNFFDKKKEESKVKISEKRIKNDYEILDKIQ